MNAHTMIHDPEIVRQLQAQADVAGIELRDLPAQLDRLLAVVGVAKLRARVTGRRRCPGDRKLRRVVYET